MFYANEKYVFFFLFAQRSIHPGYFLINTIKYYLGVPIKCVPSLVSLHSSFQAYD